MAEGTHWLPGSDPYDIAWKLVATNLSDLAAKGAEPVGVTLNYSLAGGEERFLSGLNAILKQYGVPLLGGDTISTKAGQTLGLTAIGRATHRPVPSRSGAQIGDLIYLCGTIGDAMAGYNELTAPDRAREMGFALSSDYQPDPYFAERFLRPTPLIERGIELAPIVTAMMDVSDGLFLDAKRMAQASGAAFHIDLDAVPHSEEFKHYATQGNQLDVMSKGWPTRKAACSWGDDYALLFTASPSRQIPSECTQIGVVKQMARHRLLVDGKPLQGENLGFEHSK